MTADIQNTVERIENRINELQQTIDGLERTKTTLLQEFTNGSRPKYKASAVKASNNGHGDKSRKQQVMDLIKANGPMKRKALMQASGAPIGTISYLLHDKETFRRLEDGRWDLTTNVHATDSLVIGSAKVKANHQEERIG